MATAVPLPVDADHRVAELAYTSAGWTFCGAGDWAIALRSPDGHTAVRISPFDPTGPYTAELYRRAAHTGQVPHLVAHRRLAGGGDLMELEWLAPADEREAVAFHRLIADHDPAVADLVRILHQVHIRALRDLPWCGPLDDNPHNVMRATHGRLVLTDPYYADGPNLYATAASNPDAVVTRIPEHERRFMTEIPLAASGPWDATDRDALRRGLAAADARHH